MSRVYLHVMLSKLPLLSNPLPLIPSPQRSLRALEANKLPSTEEQKDQETLLDAITASVMLRDDPYVRDCITER